VAPLPPGRARADAALGARPIAIATEDAAINHHAIGRHGLELLRENGASADRGPINVMDPLQRRRAIATLRLGAPRRRRCFLAHAEGLPVHVWISETRARGCKAPIWTALGDESARHSATRCSSIRRADFLMRRGDVDAVLVGADSRGAQTATSCNKIGTYEKALGRARDNKRALLRSRLPSPTIDWKLASGRHGHH